MQSTDSDHFFQTDASQAERDRRAAKAGNRHGNPLRMKSKILAAIADPAEPGKSLFVAESAGHVRRIHFDSAGPKSSYRGPQAPVTCLAVGGQGAMTLFAGSWDRDVWSWNVDSARFRRRYTGHSDFVKAVACGLLAGRHVLLSGGADRKIMVWDIETGRRLHTVQDPTATMRAIQHLAIDSVISTHDALVFVSASSDPVIRRWKVSADSFAQLPGSIGGGAKPAAIKEHETSVYRLVFDHTDEAADLWTASADGTTKCLVRSRDFAADDVFVHGDHVRAVQVSSCWVVTAGRDENVKIWDRATGQHYCTLEGHYEEVTDLVLLQSAPGSAETVCSVSIDGTIRTWPLDKAALDNVLSEMRALRETGQAETTSAQDGELLTAEEEAELAELMDD